MNAFWKWLIRADGRMVFLCTVAVFCVVAVWWGWRISQSVDAPAAQHSSTTDRPASAELALNSFLRRESNTQLYSVPATPFLYIERRRPPRDPRPRHDPVEDPAQLERTAQTQQTVDTDITAVVSVDNGGVSTEVRPPRVDPQPRQPDPGPPLRLTYRGYMHRSDGTMLALIEDSRSESSAFHPVGTNLFDITIKHPDGDSLEVLSPAGTSYTIRRGQPAYFINGELRER